MFPTQNTSKTRKIQSYYSEMEKYTYISWCFALKPLFCCHLCSVLQICSSLKGLAKRKYLPCAPCFLKHIISKTAISSQGGFVPLNKTLTYTRRAVCSDFTAHSCVWSWAANHKIKCHNTFSKQGVWHHSWSTARYLGRHLHFETGWHLWLPVFTNKKSNYDLPESRALSFSCLATIMAVLRRAWV